MNASDRVTSNMSSSDPACGTLFGRIKIEATWDWTAVPDVVKRAALIQGNRFYERRENVGGPLIDDVQYRWAPGATELDTDVAAGVAPYRRLWAAV
jgi:hypothetical protein